MTAAEGSWLGLAKQTAKGTPNVTDASFKYMLFTAGQFGPASQTIPLDPEVGGGALLRNVLKTGVVSGGQVQFIPRPDTLGLLLLGAFGKVTSALHDGSTVAYKHTFELPANQFDAPYFTFRYAPGALWGEQYQDARLSALGLDFQAANFVRGTIGVQGGLPAKVATTTWSPAAKVDGGPQFVTAVSEIELPTGTSAKVLSGQFAAGMQIPLDEQWIVGSYVPDGFDIVQRSFGVQFVLKVDDATLYTKMAYDPAGGSAWAADMFREADFSFVLNSNTNADTAIPYSLTIKGNGESSTAANVVWSATPIGLRAGRQVVMQVSGIFLADSTAAPITAELVNTTASY